MKTNRRLRRFAQIWWIEQSLLDGKINVGEAE
jgi:hypothetical protein